MKSSLILFLAFLLIIPGVGAQIETFNTALRDSIRFMTVDNSLSPVNDIWGYVAPDGTEYALVGLRDGVSIVSLADPDNIAEVQRISGQITTWRDMKVYGSHAYVVSDNTSEGMLVIDLTGLPTNVAYEYYNLPYPPTGGQLFRAHNIFIDTTTAIAYLAGSNLNGGGMVLYELSPQGDEPSFLATGPSTDAHDVFVNDGRMYASEIGVGMLSIYDVTDPLNITFVGSDITPSAFTHNAWTTENRAYVFATDERANAPVSAWDIQDEANPVLIDEFRPERSLELGTIPHNVHVLNDYLAISYYTDGLEIVDASVPENMIEVGYFDSWPGADGGFNGNWGAYPFLPSGLVLMTDRATGLYVVEVDYIRGARLHGTITDGVTNEALNNVSIVLSGPDEKSTNTDISGGFMTGSAFGGEYLATISLAGYDVLEVPVSLENGVVTMLDTSLLSPSSTGAFIRGDVKVNVYPNPANNYFQVNYSLENETNERMKVEILDMLGRSLLTERLPLGTTGNVEIGSELATGQYILRVLVGEQTAYTTKIVKE
jgi:choice-of-anchor B domain-containing protein